MSASNRSTLGSYVTQPSGDAEDEDSLVNFTGEQEPHNPQIIATNRSGPGPSHMQESFSPVPNSPKSVPRGDGRTGNRPPLEDIEHCEPTTRPDLPMSELNTNVYESLRQMGYSYDQIEPAFSRLGCRHEEITLNSVLDELTADLVEPRGANSSVRVESGDGSRMRIVNAEGTGGAIFDMDAGIEIDGGSVSIRKGRVGSQMGSSRYPASDVPQKPKMHENFEHVVNSVRSLGYTEERIHTALNSLCSKNVEISMDKLLDELEDFETTNN